MKKKTKIIISSFAVLLVAVAVIGTVAYFSKSFSSDKNVATAASFDVDVVNADGKTIGNGEFNLGEKLYPGMDAMEVYSFQIKKGKTDVPVEYSVNLNASGDLFPKDGSPVVLKLQRNVDNNWVDVDSSAFSPESDTESFRVMVSWPHGDNDIDFQGATGNVKLDVVATQVDVPANDITGNLVNTANGKAAIDPAKTIVSYKFDEGYAPEMSGFQFYINDGDGYVNNWYRSSTQKVINGVVHPRTGVEVAEAIVRDFYVTQKGSFTPLTNKWDITNVGSEVIFTSKADKAYNDFQIIISDNRAGIEGEFLKKQAGNEGQQGVKQVSTLTVTGAINKAGKLAVTFTDGSESATKSIEVAKNDSHATVAAKIAKAFGSLNGWTVTNANGSADVVFTAKEASANKNVTVSIANN